MVGKAGAVTHRGEGDDAIGFLPGEVLEPAGPAAAEGVCPLPGEAAVDRVLEGEAVALVQGLRQGAGLHQIAQVPAAGGGPAQIGGEHVLVGEEGVAEGGAAAGGGLHPVGAVPQLLDGVEEGVAGEGGVVVQGGVAQGPQQVHIAEFVGGLDPVEALVGDGRGGEEGLLPLGHPGGRAQEQRCLERPLYQAGQQQGPGEGPSP